MNRWQILGCRFELLNGRYVGEGGSLRTHGRYEMQHFMTKKLASFASYRPFK